MQNLILMCDTKAQECNVKSRAYTIWLSSLVPTNIILVIGGSLFSLISGSSLLIQQSIITPFGAGILALISSAFALTHTKLNCDQHQSECKRLRNIYRGLEEEYLNLKIIRNEDELRDRLNTINNEFIFVLKSSGAEPSEKALNKAKKELM